MEAKVIGVVEFNVFDPGAPEGLSWRQFRVSEFRPVEDGWEYRLPGESPGWMPAESVRGFRLLEVDLSVKAERLRQAWISMEDAC